MLPAIQADPLRYAVLFTTYSWDPFVARQYERIASRVRSGDLYIIADETHGKLVTLPNERVIRTNQAEILHHGGRMPFMEKGDWEVKAPLWWNLDYLTYRFYDDHQEYDYCITMDYDACITVDVDKLVKDVAKAGYDFVALPVAEDMKDWVWQKPHDKIYPLKELEAHILCVTVISRNAANYLARRRYEMAKDYSAGRIKFWPFCEAFMTMELKRAGFRIGNIAEFGNIDKFGWWPVYNEDDIVKSMPEGFVHPVMDERRFLSAFLQRYKPVYDFILPHGPLWKRLRQFPFAHYSSHIWPVVKLRGSRWLGRKLKKLKAKSATLPPKV